ncbi:SEC-C domain-containing protein, partial [bacterium]|nr:SEC-C domain-containing protein [bacterium]
GRPVLVGTISIEKSEYISSLLKKKGIKHNILNAKHHEKEAFIIAQAGRLGAVTIATNMAGRGTDILLGGNPEYLAFEEIKTRRISPEHPNYNSVKDEIFAKAKKITDEEHAKVVELGGLHVIGTERHESRRIDNQLRGRAARQGDPGSTRFFLSLQDNLMRIFGGEQVIKLMETFNVDDDMAIESPLITRQIQSSQKKVETYHFDIRKHVLEYDDVMNMQREKFYSQRQRVLKGENLYEDILYMIDCELDRLLKSYIAPGMDPSEYTKEDVETLVKELISLAPQLSGKISTQDVLGLRYENVYEKMKDMLIDAYKSHELEIINFYNDIVSKYERDFEAQKPFDSDNVMRSLERDILLRVIDMKWIDHLHNIDMLRDGIGLRAYGQKDPLIEYKKEAYDLFNKMMYEIQSETVKHIFRSKFGIQIINPTGQDIEEEVYKQEPSIPIEIENQIQQDITCPCGSGKKYEECCGKNKNNK